MRIPHRTGAVIAGIDRNGKKQPNLSGDEVLQAGDELLVIGAKEELRALNALLDEPGAREGTGDVALGLP